MYLRSFWLLSCVECWLLPVDLCSRGTLYSCRLHNNGGLWCGFYAFWLNDWLSFSLFRTVYVGMRNVLALFPRLLTWLSLARSTSHSQSTINFPSFSSLLILCASCNLTEGFVRGINTLPPHLPSASVRIFNSLLWLNNKSVYCIRERACCTDECLSLYVSLSDPRYAALFPFNSFSYDYRSN